MSQSRYQESKSIQWVKVNTTNPSPCHTMMFSKKSNFIVIKIQFQIESIPIFIGRNPISHWNKSNFTLKNPISYWKKSNITNEEIQFHIGGNLMSNWKKYNFTLKEIQFHMRRNPISLILKSLIHNSKVHQQFKRSPIVQKLIHNSILHPKLWVSLNYGWNLYGFSTN